MKGTQLSSASLQYSYGPVHPWIPSLSQQTKTKIHDLDSSEMNIRLFKVGSKLIFEYNLTLLPLHSWLWQRGDEDVQSLSDKHSRHWKCKWNIEKLDFDYKHENNDDLYYNILYTLHYLRKRYDLDSMGVKSCMEDRNLKFKIMLIRIINNSKISFEKLSLNRVS